MKSNILEDRASILIVDDDPVCLDSLGETLKKEGYQVYSANSGSQALEIIKKRPISLIICEQNIPDIKGSEVLQRSLKIRPDASRILMTEGSEFHTAIQAINLAQVNHFITKPWNLDEVTHLIRESLNRYKLIRENQILQDLFFNQHKKLKRAHENLQRDLKLSARIQEKLLLGHVPKDISGLAIDATSVSSQEVDGDFFEFYRPTTNVLDFVIGDVMGKGIAAALVGTAIKTQFLRFAKPYFHGHSFKKSIGWAEDHLTPQEILSLVHEAVIDQLIHLEYFATLFYCRFYLREHKLTYIDCGSAKPIHYRVGDKKCFFLQGENLPLGVVEKAQYKAFSTQYAPGDLFVFYSDGVTEARSPNNEFYGTNRLLELVQKFTHLKPDEILSLIKQSVFYFTQRERLEDDVTIIVIKITSEHKPQISTSKTAQFIADLSQLHAVRGFVKDLCQHAPGDNERLSNLLQLAINEIFCNIAKHSYKRKEKGNILVQGMVGEDGIVLDIADQGISAKPKYIPHPDFSGEQECGFGWYIIKEIADELKYSPKKSEKGWNHLQVFKRYIFGGGTMNIVHNKHNRILIITPQGESLDAKYAPSFKQNVMELIANQNSQQVLFDLHQLQFIDSSGLGCFLSFLKLSNTQGG